MTLRRPRRPVLDALKAAQTSQARAFAAIAAAREAQARAEAELSPSLRRAPLDVIQAALSAEGISAQVSAVYGRVVIKGPALVIRADAPGDTGGPPRHMAQPLTGYQRGGMAARAQRRAADAAIVEFVAAAARRLLQAELGSAEGSL